MNVAKRQTWLWLLLTIIGVAVFSRLGLWQLDRASQKQAWAEAVMQADQAVPLTNADVIQERQQASALHRRVRLQGQWMPEHAVYLENRTMVGRTGFLLVMPLVLDNQATVVVQRGWIPRHQLDPYRLAPVDTPLGRVTVEGMVSAPPSQYFALDGAASAGEIRANLDWQAYASELGREIGVWSVREVGERSEGLLRSWDPIDAKIPTHYGYAVQWFSLAALTVVLYVWLQIYQPRKRRA